MTSEFFTELEEFEVSPIIIPFYEREFLTYVASRVSPSVAGYAELLAYGRWIVKGRRPQEFGRAEEDERLWCCERLTGLSTAEDLRAVPRQWWEDHPEYQEWWNRWFGNPTGHWPDGIYREHTQKEEEE